LDILDILDIRMSSMKLIKITSDKPLFNKLRLSSRYSMKMKYEREVYWGLLLKEYKSLINKNLV
jgi:hypothetical protein